jgi:hypothetical protein
LEFVVTLGVAIEAPFNPGNCTGLERTLNDDLLGDCVLEFPLEELHPVANSIVAVSTKSIFFFMIIFLLDRKHKAPIQLDLAIPYPFPDTAHQKH